MSVKNFGAACAKIFEMVKSVTGDVKVSTDGNLQEQIAAIISGAKVAYKASKWSAARNINGMSVDGSADRVNYGTCSTAAGTAAKTVSCTGFALITGAEVTVKFTVTNTAASPTLNVNSTGAKAIYYRGEAISAGNLAANRTYTFRYNGTQYELVGDINTDNNTTYGVATTSANGLMSSSDKSKLDGIASGANKTTVDSALSSSSTNPVQNKVIKSALDGKSNTSHGKHVPDTCDTITDWNSATTTGWYMASGAANAPTTNAWYMGYVVAHNSNYVFQEVYQFTASADAKAVPKYIRIKNNGTWGAWTNVTVAKAVPSDAKFTDNNTTYGVATTSANGLMSSSDKSKLDGIASGANKTTVDSALSSSSTNPVQNKVVSAEIDNLKKSVSDGKKAVANAITGKGVTTATDAEFATMATNITTMGTNQYNAGVSATKKGTAGAADVLTGKTFTNSSGVAISGTMPDLTAKSTIAHESGNGTKVIVGDAAFLATNTDGVQRAEIRYNGDTGRISGNTLFAIPVATMRSTINGGTDATAAQILTGKKAYVGSTLVTGTMANQGAKTTELSAGGSYNIPAGYHNGSGKITAKSLASQTSGNAYSSDIAYGKIAWVNGTKVTGTFIDKTRVYAIKRTLNYDGSDNNSTISLDVLGGEDIPFFNYMLVLRVETSYGSVHKAVFNQSSVSVSVPIHSSGSVTTFSLHMPDKDCLDESYITVIGSFFAYTAQIYAYIVGFDEFK